MYGNDQPENQKNPYLNTDYNSLYNFDPEEETFSNTENVRIKSFIAQTKTMVQSNQRTKKVLKIKVIKAEIPDINLFVD